MSQQPRSKWRVTGRRHDTGESVNLHVEARNRERAVRAVEKRGIEVTGIEPVAGGALSYQAPTEPPEAQVVYVENIRPGAAFKAGFYAFLGAFVAYLIVGIAVAAVLLSTGVVTLGR